jgi:predicted HTH domain antitoxin
MKQSAEEFEDEARLLLAVKLYELGRESTGTAAELAGISRVAFIFQEGLAEGTRGRMRPSASST